MNLNPIYVAFCSIPFVRKALFDPLQGDPDPIQVSKDNVKTLRDLL
jgi:hypothetical protein